MFRVKDEPLFKKTIKLQHIQTKVKQTKKKNLMVEGNNTMSKALIWCLFDMKKRPDILVTH